MPQIELSVVIIAKNEAHQIVRCIEAAKRVSNDIWVIDSDSSDQTPELVKSAGANYVNHAWKGFAEQKNYGNSLAKSDWILSLDADELLTLNLAHEIRQLDLSRKNKVYAVNRLNHIGESPIYYGNWNPDWQNRLFNKQTHQWNSALAVHETLQLSAHSEVIQLNERLLHYTVQNFEGYQQKLNKYAALFRNKNKDQHAFIRTMKHLFSPLFGLIKEFIFKKGFLDGKAGFQLALLHFNYTKNKYKKLQA